MNRTIEISKGEKLDLLITPQFEKMIRQRFGLNDSSEIEDAHMKIFLTDIFANTLENIDKEYDQRLL